MEISLQIFDVKVSLGTYEQCFAVYRINLTYTMEVHVSKLRNASLL
jgi:hypothetical protein